MSASAVSEPGANILVTAPSGEGKTTLMERLAERLRDLRPGGFYTAEIRREGRRTGFRLVGLDGTEAVLAHVDLPLPRRVGRYGVDVRAFDAFLRNLDTRGRPVLLVDEIGKMECASPRFRGLVHHWLDGPAAVVATVAEKGSGLIEEVKLRPDCELHVLSRPRAGALLEELVEKVCRSVGSVAGGVS
ncbi:MAG: nucleoside-triphosphatase [Deferrisomatales bacterium]